MAPTGLNQSAAMETAPHHSHITHSGWVGTVTMLSWWQYVIVKQDHTRMHIITHMECPLLPRPPPSCPAHLLPAPPTSLLLPCPSPSSYWSCHSHTSSFPPHSPYLLQRVTEANILLQRQEVADLFFIHKGVNGRRIAAGACWGEELIHSFQGL